MVTVTLQVGQCGNQLGQSLWQQLCAQRSGGLEVSEDREFFRQDATGRKHARCLLVDTEPKVVRHPRHSWIWRAMGYVRCAITPAPGALVGS